MAEFVNSRHRQPGNGNQLAVDVGHDGADPPIQRSGRVASGSVELMQDETIDIEPQQPLPRGVPCRPFPEFAGTVNDDVRDHADRYSSLINIPSPSPSQAPHGHRSLAHLAMCKLSAA